MPRVSAGVNSATMFLSQECHQQKQTITVLQREVDSIRGDNVKLYEKIKFLQSYPGTVSNHCPA